MQRVLLRKTKAATVSVDEALAVVRSLDKGRLVDQSRDNVLIDVDPRAIVLLKERLTGWIVSPQEETIPVPDTRVKIRSAPR